MIKHSGIKSICHFLMAMMYFISIIILILGFSICFDEKHKLHYFGILIIIGSILLPIVVTVALYPIFALANIDQNTEEINKKLDLIINSKEENNKNDEFNNDNQESHENKNDHNNQNFYTDHHNDTQIDQETIEVIETLENIISSELNIEEMKYQIYNIKSDDNMVLLLKKRVANDKTKKDVFKSIDLFIQLVKNK